MSFAKSELMSNKNVPFRVAFVCDFFYPRLGGVENHLWSLAQLLLRRGHKVVIITHSYGNRKGVRYHPGGLKVYYCPILPMTDQDAFPTFTATFPLLRWIFIREGIQIVHAHQATSTMANESVVYASEMGLSSVYTDHSLFGFDDVASLILNRVLQTTLSTVGAAIGVSHTCRANLVLRASLDPKITHVIPNAVDPSQFTPRKEILSKERIQIVVVSRLVYRKGVDLLVGSIPLLCHKFPQVDFIIGGDGNKRLALHEMVERERLDDRVEFLGAVPHDQVCQVLRRGHIFLNCSLTESFCIALLEASSCGLLIVSTNVEGVPEVLPPDMILLADPSVAGVVAKVEEAIVSGKLLTVDPWKFHSQIQQMYSWNRVASETELVFEQVMLQTRYTFLERLGRYRQMGGMAGYVACFIAIYVHFWVKAVEWWQPGEIIDVVPDFCLCKPQTSKSCIFSNN